MSAVLLAAYCTAAVVLPFANLAASVSRAVLEPSTYDGAYAGAAAPEPYTVCRC